MNLKYSVIVFDLGNVLIPFDYKIMTDRLNKVSSGLGEKFLAEYKNNYHIHRSYESGTMTDQQFIDKMLNILDHKIDSETFCRFFSEIFRVNHDVANSLPKLKKNYKLILLSNTNSIHKKFGWEKFDFLKHFDRLILSHKVGAVKPEEKIYRAVETVSGFPPAQHLFIDDVKEYCDAAIKLGWDAINFVSYENLIQEFQVREVL